MNHCCLQQKKRRNKQNQPAALKNRVIRRQPKPQQESWPIDEQHDKNGRKRQIKQPVPNRHQFRTKPSHLGQGAFVCQTNNRSKNNIRCTKKSTSDVELHVNRKKPMHKQTSFVECVAAISYPASGTQQETAATTNDLYLRTVT
jgi:hypothetical protein